MTRRIISQLLCKITADEKPVSTYSGIFGVVIAISILSVYTLLTGTAPSVYIGLALGGIIAFSLALSGSTSRILSVVGLLMFLFAAPLALSYVVYNTVLEDIVFGLLVLAGTLAGFGILRLRLDTFSRTALQTTLLRVSGAVIILGIVAGILVVRQDGVGLLLDTDYTAVISESILYAISPPQNTGTVLDGSQLSAITLVLLGAYATAGSYLLIIVLPILELAPQSKQEYYNRYVRSAKLLAVSLLSGIAFVVSVGYFYAQTEYPNIGAFESLVTTIVTAGTFHRIFLWVGTIGFILALLFWIGSYLAALYLSTDHVRGMVTIVSATIFGLTIAAADRFLIDEIYDRLPVGLESGFENIITNIGVTPTALSIVTVLLAVTAFVFAIVYLLAMTGFLRTRTASARLLLYSLLIAVIVAAFDDVASPYLFLGIFALVVVWDLLEYGLGIGETLGKNAQSRHGELIHATGSIFIGGALFIGVLLTEDYLLSVEPVPEFSTYAILVTVFAAIVLTIFLRG